jgi:putative NADPH-quinone reductase
MPTRILTLDLHPAKLSLSAALAQAYRDGAKAAGHQVRHLALSEMGFNPDFGQASFRNAPTPEQDLAGFQTDIGWAQHIVLVSPMWWGGLPAQAKGLFDRSFLPGFAFDPRQRRFGLPKPLLIGRSARLVLTSDTPGWAFWLMYRSALRHQVQRQILGYVGIRPMGFTHLSPVEHSTDRQRAGWLERMRSLGARAA